MRPAKFSVIISSTSHCAQQSLLAVATSNRCNSACPWVSYIGEATPLTSAARRGGTKQASNQRRCLIATLISMCYRACKAGYELGCFGGPTGRNVILLEGLRLLVSLLSSNVGLLLSCLLTCKGLTRSDRK